MAHFHADATAATAADAGAHADVPYLYPTDVASDAAAGAHAVWRAERPLAGTEPWVRRSDAVWRAERPLAVWRAGTEPWVRRSYPIHDFELHELRVWCIHPTTGLQAKSCPRGLRCARARTRARARARARTRCYPRIPHARRRRGRVA